MTNDECRRNDEARMTSGSITRDRFDGVRMTLGSYLVSPNLGED